MSRHPRLLTSSVALALALAFAAPAAASPSGIVISEFRAHGPSGGNDEFIELMNTGASVVNISGWKVQGCASGSGAASDRATIPANTSLPAGGHFLLVNNAASGYSGSVAGDATYNTGISPTGMSGIRVVNSSSVVQDTLGTTTSPCREGTGIASAFSNNASDTNTYRRKVSGTQDTDNNANDFTGPGSSVPERCGCAGTGGGGGGVTKISEIQGAGYTSPKAGDTVTIEAVVTGVDNEKGASISGTNTVSTFRSDRGLYVQEEPADQDGSAATSEGIFVGYVDDPLAYPVGTRVRVTGQVAEQFGLTQVSESTGLEPTNLGVASPAQTPAATTIDTATAQAQTVSPTADDCGFPADTCTSGRRSYYESLEGMKVTLPLAVANSGGTNKFGELFLTPGATQDRVVRTDDTAGPGGTPDAQIRSLVAADADGGASDPANPLISYLDSSTLTEADLFDSVSDVSGPLGFSFSNYKVVVQPGAEPTVTDGPTTYPYALPAVDHDALRVASFNVENYFPVGGGLDGRTISAAEYAEKREEIVAAIEDRLELPDVVAVQEVVNKAILDDVADDLPGYTAYLEEGNDNRGIDVGFLVRDTVRVTGVMQFGKTATNPTSSTCADIAGRLFDRPPLRLDVVGKGLRFSLFSSHFSSKAAPDACRVAQAAYLRDRVADLEAAGKQAIVAGDLNAFEDEGALDTLQDGTTTLTNLWGQAPADNRYSFQFNGRLQTLDHVLVTDGLDARVADVRYAHFDNDYSDRKVASDGQNASDHDPPVVELRADCTITGNAGPETLTGTPGDDVICGLGGNDYLQGLGGDDVLRGGDGDDTIIGGTGDNTIDGEAGNDVLGASSGDDLIAGGTGTDRLTYADRTAASPVHVELRHAAGAPFDGALGGVSYTAQNGSPSLGEDDWVFADVEDLRGSTGPDELTGGDGPNVIAGQEGADVISGLGGADVLRGFAGADQIHGGEGADVVQDGDGDDNVWGDEGDDTLYGELGADVLRGGAGFDHAEYGGRAADVTITLDAGTMDDGAAGEGDDVRTIESVQTGSGNDRLTGNDADNVLRANGGNDVIDGRLGVDQLFGSGGTDRLVGDDRDDPAGPKADKLDCGSGSDTYVTDALDSRIGCETAGV
ncbi:MAG: lamin tail domain-containing protein [Solirubrobacteraceae bacterium]|nr:lamin tail domain-containing protein [Solirubrobacteraceae bacterium]